MRRLSMAVAVVSLVLAACGQPAEVGTSAAPSATVAATASPTPGGTAIVAIWQFPATLAAHYANQTVTTIVNNGVLEGLAATATDGSYYPVLATEVPTLANGGAKVTADGKKLDVTWKLKSGIKWSDGTPLTSADIKYTWEIWMKDPKVNNRTGFSEIESIDLPNETTAVVHYKSIYAPYVGNFF